MVTKIDEIIKGKQQPHAPVEDLMPVLDMSTWDDSPAPGPEYVVPNRIPKDQTSLLTGPGGGGKSILLMQLLASTVLSREWLGITPEQGPAIFVEAEDGERIIRYRMEQILHHPIYDSRFADVIGQLHLVSLHGQDATLGAPNRDGVIQPTARYGRLLEMCGDIKPKIIGIASSADVYAGDERNRSQVRQFIGLLTRLAIVAHGATSLIAHPSLTGMNTGTGISGSTQWHNAVRARMYLHGADGKDEDEVESSHLRQLEFKKNQYGPISERIALRWTNGLWLPMDINEFNISAKMEEAKRVFVAVLQRLYKDGRWVSANTSPTYAPKIIAEQPDAHGISKEVLTRAMNALLADKMIGVEKYGPASRSSRLYVAGKQEEMNLSQPSERASTAKARETPPPSRFRVIGPEPDTPCEHCDKKDGDVYLIQDPRHAVRSHALHEKCAEEFYDRRKEP